MKNNKFKEFFKGKGYYVLLFVGVVAIATVALIGSTLSSGQKENNKNSVDLNEQDNNIAANENNNQTAKNNQASGNVANKEQSGNSSNDAATKDLEIQKSASNDPELEGYADGLEADKAEVARAEAAKAQAKQEEPAIATSGKTVQADIAKAVESLSFKADDGLLWPIAGNVIMKYSMDHTIYYATLMEYKCNPAILIGATEGTKVKAAAEGIIEKIDTDNEETGYTVTMNIGNDYHLVYGQLKNDSKLKVGDMIKEGEVIGTVEKPTKYYTVEGSNLYFEVMQKDSTINPMLLLRDNKKEE